jgi:hypothetical protein
MDTYDARPAMTAPSRRPAADLPATGSELSVLRSTQRQAFAVPGRPSHLDHHHHLHHTAVDLAAAVNPLLHRLRDAVETATERWADEDAAALCRRDTVADALTQAATGTRLRVPAAVLAAARNDVVFRVQALRAPAPTLTLWRVGLPAALLLATAVAIAIAMRDTERLFELAQNTYRPGGR